MLNSDKVQVVLFSGGRGTAALGDSFVRHPQIALSILVNAYDDGLSTGRIRQWIPSMLGPSDIRKNISRLIPNTDASLRALQYLLEYRLPEKMNPDDAEFALSDLFGNLKTPLSDPLSTVLKDLSVGQKDKIEHYLKFWLDYCESVQQRRNLRFDYGDCSFGNILFAGAFLLKDQDFNRTIDEFQTFAKNQGRVLNVTCGEPLVLVALKQDGLFLRDEAEIVSRQDDTRISDIFLLGNYLSIHERSELNKLDIEEKKRFLADRAQTPALNPAVAEVLTQADLIIYGPGTQHSSLFPSYLTEGLGEQIAANSKAEKVFISNIRRDHEIQSETANSLAHKLIHYLKRKGVVSLSNENLVSTYFFQELEGDRQDLGYVPVDKTQLPGATPGAVRIADWEEGIGVHSGGRILDELISRVNDRAQKQLRSQPYMVSIVVPCLDEQKTVQQVLHELVLLNLQEYGLGKEIILVDGGSNDESFEIAQREPSVRCYQLPRGSGRGLALRTGIEKSHGNLIVFFPSDREYQAKDLIPIVRQIASNEFRVIFGSRAIKCIDLSDRIRQIYRGDTFGYLASKYGGMLLSLLSMVLYSRFVSDPLTGIKGFDSRLLRSLNLQSDGVNLETEIVAKVARKREFILELPVEYRPRGRNEGKKVSLRDGLKCIWNLLRWRALRYENSVYRSSSI